MIKYDKTLIKHTCDVAPPKKHNPFIFYFPISTKVLVSRQKNYLSYVEWCKASNCHTENLVFLCKRLDKYEKLDFTLPVKQTGFCSSLKRIMMISLKFSRMCLFNFTNII